MRFVRHGPGGLKRMNHYAVLENEAGNKESLEIKTENNIVASEVKVIVKDNLEVSEETSKKKT